MLIKYLINKDINSDDNSDSDANKKENWYTLFLLNRFSSKGELNIIYIISTSINLEII